MKDVASKILEHPDKDEIIAKLVAGVAVSDIHEWLESKYESVGEKKFALSAKIITTFQKDYLDFYNTIREDLMKTKQMSASDTLTNEVQGSVAYKKALETYLNSEIDIKLMVKQALAAIEFRTAQVFDQIQEDPTNVRIDRTLIEWFNTLSVLMEKYDGIQNGTLEQVNITNNINIQVIDKHINVIYDIIKEILARLDYDTSLMFIDMFNEAMAKLELPEVASVENRLVEAKLISDEAADKLAK
jgi:hypothetical protein